MKRVVIPQTVQAGNWPRLPASAVPEEHWQLFCRRRTAVQMYIEGHALRAIEQRTHLKGWEVNRLASRFLTLDDQGQCIGERALLPHIHLKPYERRKPSGNKYSGQQGGMSGCLQQLLETYPEIEERMVAVLKDSAQMLDDHRNAIAFLTKKFMQVLHAIAPDHRGWPYTTKYQGRVSIRRYILALRNHVPGSYINAHGSSEARAHIVTGTGHRPYLAAQRPFDIVELDGHFISAFFVLLVEQVNGLMFPIPLDRMWLLAAIDQYSHAVLAYKLVLRSQPGASDVREVLVRASLGGWKAQTLENTNFSYKVDAGFPSSVIEECCGVMFSVLSVDSHLSNIAKKITLQARQDFGFHHYLGPTGRFETRAKIERLFAEVVRHTALLPSTTGSHPRHGRADGAQEKAVEYQLDLTRFIQALDVALANYNTEPSEGIGMFSPLGLIRQYMSQAAILPRIAVERRERLKVDLITKYVTVRGSLAEGRRPYIMLDRVRYTSEHLAANFDLIGFKLCVEIDEHDYRAVNAFLPNGAAIGVLHACGWWATFRHTPYIRRLVNSLIGQRALTITEDLPPSQQICDYFIRHNEPNRALLVKQAEDPSLSTLPRAVVPVKKPVKDYLLQPDQEYPGLPAAGQADNRGGS
ncbi:hypothetical protein CXG50_07375 [Pseudomonas plecoglossicida]|nr:hypothetical protein B479_13970 [Pseudomonas putida HB3267]PLP92965.1 hypothetical protein CX682_08275 [Pseudomonas sp. FFUP_PS_41]PLV00126.1 hypothetical protein CXG52_04220 [Pseudomonas plecoglossicida]PLV10485.1 hypothetical protein CXG50_07375 [Pseudomonas plecoglossicida]